ncbi:hypothetical protein E4U39_006100 [Claviceps sp. Clav50 group G5]|nr:hypothetical protein E4U39_006100 [Claviceps sp. Clav50 group G5]
MAIKTGQEDKIVINGTIQQVDAYMEAHYPGWSATVANFTYSHSASANRAPATREHARGDDFRFYEGEVGPLTDQLG